MLVVQPYDKTAMPAIEKAIMQSDIGATPNSDGNLIRINIPALTAVSCQACRCCIAHYPSDSFAKIGFLHVEMMHVCRTEERK